MLTKAIFVLLFLKFLSANETSEELEGTLERFKIEGKAINQFTTDESWVHKARVIIDGGLHIGFLKSDGSFVLHGIAPGSYVLELLHPNFEFESLRVEITSKGKLRARALDNIQPFLVRNVVVYPLRLRCRKVINYFQQREQLHISDFLFNPMVMTTLVSLLFIFLLPKLINSQDPELQREMQNSMNLLSPKNNIDIPEMFAKWSKRNPLAPTTSKTSTNKLKKPPKVAKLKQT